MKSVLLLIILAALCYSSYAQDSTRVNVAKHYKEHGFTVGYHYNFGDKVEEERPEPVHLIELGLWKSGIWIGHHAFIATYYFASDFKLNTDNFVVGPKLGGFFSVLPMGFGGELCYYTDFHSSSLRFIPAVGLFTPYFKLTISQHLALTNKDFQELNKYSVSLTVRVFKIKGAGVE